MRIAIQIRELVSSNLSTLVEAASDPAKMLRLLQRELREFVIALQGDLSKAQRRQERLSEEAARLDGLAAEWSEKAQVAMSHKREDLARAALLTREQTFADAAKARSEAAAAAEEAEEIAEAMAQLEAKLTETDARLADELARPKPAPAGTAATPAATRSERFIDRVATLEKRVDFVAERHAEPAPSSVEAEIEQLAREAKVTAELAAMKAATKAPAKKGRARK